MMQLDSAISMKYVEKILSLHKERGSSTKPMWKGIVLQIYTFEGFNSMVELFISMSSTIFQKHGRVQFYISSDMEAIFLILPKLYTYKTKLEEVFLYVFLPPRVCSLNDSHHGRMERNSLQCIFNINNRISSAHEFKHHRILYENHLTVPFSIRKKEDLEHNCTYLEQKTQYHLKALFPWSSHKNIAIKRHFKQHIDALIVSFKLFFESFRSKMFSV